MQASDALTPETLFQTHVWPFYPSDVRADWPAARERDANPAKNPSILQHLEDAAGRFVTGARALFGDVELELDGSDASVHRLSAALTKERRNQWASARPEGDPDEAPSMLFHALVHGAAYVGQCIVKNHGGTWGVRRPLWESVVDVRSAKGEGSLPVFHWLVRALSDADLGTYSLADRYRAYVEAPRKDVSTLPIIFAGERKLPRLQKVRYDVLYKYMKAHLPELKDLGADFPSPERFEAYGFHWMEPVILGEGRMVLLYGRGEAGLHLFWLGASGFEAALYLPCDKFPDPRVLIQGDKLQIHFAHEEKVMCHEVLWWGP